MRNMVYYRLGTIVLRLDTLLEDLMLQSLFARFVLRKDLVSKWPSAKKDQKLDTKLEDFLREASFLRDQSLDRLIT